MGAEKNVDVRVTRRFVASPRPVFDAWLNPEKARRFLFATESGQLTRVGIDAHVGGSFIFVDQQDGKEIEHTGKYLEIDRPQLLVFTLSGGKYAFGDSRVIIEIAPLGAGCELALTHVGVRPDQAKRAEKGWIDMLGGLAWSLGEGLGPSVGTPVEKRGEPR